jgi:hypothetical protein
VSSTKAHDRYRVANTAHARAGLQLPKCGKRDSGLDLLS